MQLQNSTRRGAVAIIMPAEAPGDNPHIAVLKTNLGFLRDQVGLGPYKGANKDERRLEARVHRHDAGERTVEVEVSHSGISHARDFVDLEHVDNGYHGLPVPIQGPGEKIYLFKDDVDWDPKSQLLTFRIPHYNSRRAQQSAGTKLVGNDMPPELMDEYRDLAHRGHKFKTGDGTLLNSAAATIEILRKHGYSL